MAEMPPLPQPPGFQDDAALSRSELMPFRSKNISLFKSRALIPLLVTAVVCVLLFALQGSISTIADVLNYLKVVATFLVFVIFLGLYVYAGERKNMLWYLIPAGITFVQLMFFLEPYFFVFRKILPGNIEAEGFLSAFVGMFFGAGLLEELLKAVPALLALVFALVLRSKGRTGGFLGRGLALQGPIDGLLMGAAAGAAFILFETLLQYVPNEVQRVARANNGNMALGALQGVLLLFPRVLNGVIGHMAWAGISGYFIGLVVSHRRAWWKLLLVAWLTPAILHGFWNSSWWLLGDYGSWVSAALSLFVFASCLLKAKQLEVSRLGGSVDGHSILAVTPPPHLAGAGPAGILPPKAPGVAGVFTGVATFLEKLVAFRAHTTVPNPGAVMAPPPMPATAAAYAAPAIPAAQPPAMPAPGPAAAAPPSMPIAAPRLSIGNGTVRYALAAGQPIDFSALFGADGVPAGCSGLIGAPSGQGFDIANTGSATWAATGPDGATVSVPPGSRAATAAGTRLRLGTATIDVQSY